MIHPSIPRFHPLASDRSPYFSLEKSQLTPTELSSPVVKPIEVLLLLVNKS
uniref:Uncharacterized protein n=1 Tax=Oryza brachyantha TaxID=4533 RepID=J3LSF3_ORYBR